MKEAGSGASSERLPPGTYTPGMARHRRRPLHRRSLHRRPLHRRRRFWTLSKLSVLGAVVCLSVGTVGAALGVYGPRARQASAGARTAAGPAAQDASARAAAASSAGLPPPADPSAPARIVTPGANVPNPFVLADGGYYYLYSSQYGIYGPNIPVRESTTPDSWGPPTDAMPTLPPWAHPAYTWAPDVRRVGGRFVMWFSAWLRGREPITQCIGVATSASPLGPFVAGDHPVICQLDRNGSIDPRTMVDPKGDLWLYWKSDDNADVNGTSHSSIYAQQLAPDGTTLLGQPTILLTAQQPWEGRIVEAPDMVFGGGHYWLFYSGNWFNEPYYAIGVAECAGPAGPCTRPYSGPWLSSDSQGSGPGEESLFSAGGQLWIVYSPWAVDYRQNTPRPVALARVAFDSKGPYLAAAH